MDRKTLTDLINAGPIRVRMNSGQTFEIPGAEFAIVDDIAAHVLTRDPEDGRMRARVLALVCMESAEPYEPADSQ
jgi:hypothetical protein